MPATCVGLKRGVEHELSPILGPVQDQILNFRVPSYVGNLGTSVSLPQAYQENPLDITVDTGYPRILDTPKLD